MCIDEWDQMTNDYEDKIKMLEEEVLDTEKKMIVSMLNEVKAVFQLPAGHERDMLVKLEKKLFNDLLFAYNIDKKEMRITNGT